MKAPTSTINESDPSALTIEQARLRIEAAMPRIVQTEIIDCQRATGRILAEDTYSPMSVPSFRASAMDGYAVRTLDGAGPLRVTGESTAGHPGTDRLQPGCCQRIMTGARVPDDADAVVQQENVEHQQCQVVLMQPPTPGLNIREPGSDSRQGQQLLSRGDRLGPAELALLAAHGISHVAVLRKVVIGLVSTGDELRNTDKRLEMGQIYDANRPLLLSLLDGPDCDIIDLGICPDSAQALEQRLRSADEADIVISSGGVSVGDADHVRAVISRMGDIEFWKIAMKPGRPLTFGKPQPAQAIFGLPGNPVSAAITTLLFVLPAIRCMQGRETMLPPSIPLTLADPLRKNPGRVEYQRAIMHRTPDHLWQVGTTGMQDSHILNSLVKANCLIELPLESTGAEPGETVQVIPFSHFSIPIL